ncbi:MAG: phosphate ABC transporter substrate-binding protein [Proteobacteria bacterium]|nr:phosphate ABC transporter substrate-binding protein [Pseudomonadota bacterium]MBU1712777.1 phosphate ABC transporter substrate-binding protein [Pseudomonadota bacterium]
MKKKNWIAGVIIQAVIFTAGIAFAGNISINGSTTVLPIAQKVAEAYMKEHPDTAISISGGGSGNGIKAIIDKTTDIANSSRAIKKEESEQAKAKGSNPVEFIVAFDCIVPVVHPSNPLKNLTLDQLKAMYKGEIKNWKEIGGADKPIVVISRDTSSGTYEVWEEKVMKKERVFPRALLQASNGAIVQAVSKNPNAVGYIGLGYMDKSVKMLSANGINGSKETTLNKTYPISRPLYMYTPAQPKGDVKKFLDYMLSSKGQKLVEEEGFIPLK